MSARTILALANGKNVDLRNPSIDVSDIAAIGEHLAKEKRFNGATPGVEYSVAEHSVLGTDELLRIGGLGVVAAPYFLIHDAPESLFKDDTTPKKNAIAEEVEAQLGVAAAAVLAVLNALPARLDAAIHRTAGLTWPVPADIASIVKRIDKVMFVTEWRDLMGGRAHPDWSPYKDSIPLPEKITRPWPWAVARTAWLRRALSLLPALRESEGGL